MGIIQVCTTTPATCMWYHDLCSKRSFEKFCTKKKGLKDKGGCK